MLANLSEMMVRQLERNWAQDEARKNNMQLMRALSCYDTAFLFLDLSKPGDWQVMMHTTYTLPLPLRVAR